MACQATELSGEILIVSDSVYELLQALRQAMNEDTQTTAFKQFSQVQQHMNQAQQVQQVASQPPPAQLAMRECQFQLD